MSKMIENFEVSELEIAEVKKMINTGLVKITDQDNDNERMHEYIEQFKDEVYKNMDPQTKLIADNFKMFDYEQYDITDIQIGFVEILSRMLDIMDSVKEDDFDFEDGLDDIIELFQYNGEYDLFILYYAIAMKMYQDDEPDIDADMLSKLAPLCEFILFRSKN